MKKIFATALIILSLLSINKAEAIETSKICANDVTPAGWIVTSQGWEPTLCNGNSGGIFINVKNIARYETAPIGSVLTACSAWTPPGWESLGYRNDVICSATGSTPVYTITHKSCVGQSTATCYGTASINANPQTVTIPYNASNGTTVVSVTTQNTYGLPCLWVSQNGQAEQNVSCNLPTTITWNSVPKNGNSTFIVRSGDGSKTELKRLTVYGVGLAAPTVSTDPATSIVIPWGKTDANFVLKWNAPGFSSLDWCGKVNSGAWVNGLVTNGAGSSTQPISAGTTYSYRIYSPGQATGCSNSGYLSETSIMGVAGAQPTFVASPTDVKVPYPNNTGAFSLMWSAPGFAYLDWYASINGAPFVYGVSSASSGVVTENISVGSTYIYKFYEGGTNNLLGTVTVTGSR